MAANTSNNTFEAATQQFEEIMMDFFETDAEGNKFEPTAEEIENAQATIDHAKEVINETLAPIFAELEDTVEEQGKKLEALKAEVAALRAQQGAAPQPVQVGAAEPAIPFPTVAWIGEHHKDHTKSLTNYNVFALYYKFLNGGKAPERGLWEKQPNKEAWKALATQYNASNKAALAAPAAAQSAAMQVDVAQLPEKVRNSKARNAYQLFVAHWKTLPENKGLSFPTGKGFWAQQPPAVRAPFEAQFKALQAYRATKA